MAGVTVPSIDRMLAEINRVLAPPFRLPVGGPVVKPFEAKWCWADWEPGSGMPAYPSPSGYYCGLRARRDLLDLCAYHHAKKTAPDA